MAAAATADVRQPDVLAEVLVGLTRPLGGAALRSLVHARFAADAVVSNPLFSVTGRDGM